MRLMTMIQLWIQSRCDCVSVGLKSVLKLWILLRSFARRAMAADRLRKLCSTACDNVVNRGVRRRKVYEQSNRSGAQRMSRWRRQSLHFAPTDDIDPLLPQGIRIPPTAVGGWFSDPFYKHFPELNVIPPTAVGDSFQILSTRTLQNSM